MVKEEEMAQENVVQGSKGKSELLEKEMVNTVRYYFEVSRDEDSKESIRTAK